MVAHTPGPWTVCPRNAWRVCDVDNNTIASTGGDSSLAGHHEANAHLIAAAPDMLSALKIAREYVAKMLDTVKHCDDPVLNGLRADFAKIDAAIAKATGEQP